MPPVRKSKVIETHVDEVQELARWIHDTVRQECFGQFEQREFHSLPTRSQEMYSKLAKKMLTDPPRFFSRRGA